MGYLHRLDGCSGKVWGLLGILGVGKRAKRTNYFQRTRAFVHAHARHRKSSLSLSKIVRESMTHSLSPTRFPPSILRTGIRKWLRAGESISSSITETSPWCQRSPGAKQELVLLQLKSAPRANQKALLQAQRFFFFDNNNNNNNNNKGLLLAFFQC